MKESIESKINSFLDENMKLTKMPRKRRKMLWALIYLIGKFDAHAIYCERQVDFILNEWHTFSDCALLRRMMFEEGLFDRKLDGSEYKINTSQIVSLYSMLVDTM